MSDQTSEKKKRWRKKHLRTVCAFANSYGGRLSVGEIGSFSPEEAKKLSAGIYDEISEELDIHPHVRSVETGGRAYITMDIKPSPDPISFNGVYYRRVGKEDRELTGEELETFILLRDRRARLGLLVPGAVAGDLDQTAVKSFCSLAKMPETTNEELMKSLNQISDGILKGSAVVMFHKNPSQFILAPDIRIGRFSSSGTMEDMDVISGPAFLQPSETMEILSEKYLADCEYPADALKEAVINAVAHKDYSAGDPIRIRIREDSISVSNPGGIRRRDLAEGLEGVSRPTNPALSDMFFRSGKMRLMGTGIPEMQAACLRNGLNPPVIEATREDFRITFFLSSSGRSEERLSGKTLAHERGKSYADMTDEVSGRTSRTESRRSSLLTAEGTEDSAAEK